MKKILLCWLFLHYFLASAVYAQNRSRAANYLYEDNKQLVILVEDAASLLEREGEAAFKEFARRNSRWLSDKYYLFVYELNGICAFHPVSPELVGQNLRELKDFEGRPAIAMILDIGKNPQPDASGWAFYLWESQWHSYPHWKGSYIRKAIAPNGKVYLVGSGLYNIKIEKQFIEEQVDRAAELIRFKGKSEAFKELSNPSCPLNILDTYITVVDENGYVVVDPSFPNLFNNKRNILEYRDNTGRSITREIMKMLSDKESVWMMYIAPKYDTGRMARCLVYVRKVRIDGKVFYVNGSFMPAAPIWMKQ
jgi:signal transduction histidine kinase